MPSFGGVGKEAITFVLSGDASGLISEFKDVEKAADKSLGATESKIEKLSATMTKVGAVSMATGLSTALGLVQFVKDAEEAEKATNKFETAVAGMGSSIKTADIKKLAFDLQQVAQVTDEQVVAAARWGAVYGLTTDQLEELLRTAVDLSEQTGKSLDVVTKQLAKAASGEGYKGLTKLGLTFDETAYKADAFGTTIAESTEFAGGAAAKATDTMSGQLTRLGNNWDNVKEQIGVGANEVFEPLARGAADLMETLAEANPELLETIGHFTALGSLGMTGFGALSTVAGQFVNIKDAAEGLGIKLKNAEGGFTNLGKAAAGLGVAVGVLAALEGTFAAINAGKGYADQAANAIDRMNIAIGKGSGKDAFAAFKDAVRAEQDTLRLSGLWEQFGTSIAFEMDKAGTATVEGIADIENMQRALDSLSPEQAKVALDELAKFTDTLDHNSDQFKANQRFIHDNREAMEQKSEADKAARASAHNLTVEEQEQVDTLKEHEAAVKSVKDAIGTLSGASFLAAASIDQGAAAVKGFQLAASRVGIKDLTSDALALGESLDKMFQDTGIDEAIAPLAKDLPEAFDFATAAAGKYTESQSTALSALFDLAGQADATAESLLKNTGNQDLARQSLLNTAETIRSQMIPELQKQGLSLEDATARTEAYLDQLGLTPEDIETKILMSGDAEARWRLGLLAGEIATFEDSKRNEINLAIASGETQRAMELTLAELQRQANRGVVAPVWTQYMGWHGQNPYGVGFSGGGGWGGKSAPGGLSVVPMTTAPTASTRAAPTAAPITINVTAGIGDPAEIGRKVIDAIRAAERVQGRGWRAA